MDRKPISKSLRFSVIQRDQHTCQYCGRKAPETRLTIDHIIPVASGGTSEPDNLIAACVDCNAGKAASISLRPLENADLLARLDAFRERRKLLRASLKAARECARFRTERTWEFARYWIGLFSGDPADGQDWQIPRRFFSFLSTLPDTIPHETICQLIEVCANKFHGRYLKSEADAQKYFMGCVRHYREEHDEGATA